jgi:hypothetical protein
MKWVYLDWGYNATNYPFCTTHIRTKSAPSTSAKSGPTLESEWGVM